MRHLDLFFRDRVQVWDHAVGGMQIFRTLILKSETEALELHTAELLLALFFGVPSEVLEPVPCRTIAGLVFLAAQKGRAPGKWHVEYLADRWFKRIDPPPWKPDVDGYEPNDKPPELVTECRLVVNEWKNLPGHFTREMLATLENGFGDT